VLSIGDDAAAIRQRPGCLLLLSCDALIEGIHFELKSTSAKDLGWKALAVNLSDIAAMGGEPLCVTISIGLPPETPPGFTASFYRGLSEIATKHGVAVVGGDTCSSPKNLFIDVTILGEVKARKMLTRAGARPGDELYVTGTLGESAIGLELLKTRGKISQDYKHFVKRHQKPTPRLAIGKFLSSHGLATAMIDISDGLSTDLHHLCEQSNVGAVVEEFKIPLPRLTSGLKGLLSKPLIDYALNGGEDYELLFAVPPKKTHLIPSQIDGIAIHEVGKVTGRREICYIMRDNRKRRLYAGGFDHFSSS